MTEPATFLGTTVGSSFINSNAYQIATLRYVERNSLDLPDVWSPEDYRWSSVRAHLGRRAGPEWLATETVLQWFPSIEAYRSFILRDLTTSEPAVLDLGHAKAVATLMIDTHVETGVSTIQLERTILIGLSERLGRHNEQRVFDLLDLSSTRGVRDAVRRAERRIRDNPSVRDAIDGTQRWLFDVTTDPGRVAA